jgi:hypothetical protein
MEALSLWEWRWFGGPEGADDRPIVRAFVLGRTEAAVQEAAGALVARLHTPLILRCVASTEDTPQPWRPPPALRQWIATTTAPVCWVAWPVAQLLTDQFSDE